MHITKDSNLFILNSRKQFIFKLLKISSFIFVLYIISLIIFLFYARTPLNRKNIFINKTNILIVGASNIGYNYDFQMLKSELPHCNIITCSLLEPYGVGLLLENLERLDKKNKIIAIWDLPYTFYEKQKYLPLESNSFISQYTLKSVKELFSQSYSSKSVLLLPFSVIHNYNYFHSLQIDPISENSESANSGSININKNEKDFIVQSYEFDKGYIDYLLKQIDLLRFRANYFWRPAILDHGNKINYDREIYLDKKIKYLLSRRESQYSLKFFFDKRHHLNQNGKKNNTRLLIAKIKRKINL
jgi:hypothetical protein